MSNDLVDVHIGLDSIDSPYGGCTTHFTFRLILTLLKFKYVRFTDYPNLVRLNPAIPFKTRGNGATAVHLLIPKHRVSEIVDLVSSQVRKYLVEFGGSSRKAGVAVIIGNEHLEELTKLYVKALTDYVHMDYVSSIIRRLGTDIYLPLGITRGVVGALAATAALLRPCDCTYELLVYRLPPYTSERRIDSQTVKEADEKLRHCLFLNFDYVHNRPLIAPHGPDPVLLGVRGESPTCLLEALKIIKFEDQIEGWMIFRTNQGTDAHHVTRDCSSVRPFQTGCVSGVVAAQPKVLKGGDVIVPISSAGAEVFCAIFRETGLTEVARKLMKGDEVTVCGTIKYWKEIGTVIHTEKIIITQVVNEKRLNPRCPMCGHRMKSAGRNKGYKCPKCGFKTLYAEPEVLKLNREHMIGEYIPRDHAIKHLNKPKRRYGREHICTPIQPQDFLWSPP